MKILVRSFNYTVELPDVPDDWYWTWMCPQHDSAGDIGRGPYGWLFDQVADHVTTYHAKKGADR